jgi:hypothetical protein
MKSMLKRIKVNKVTYNLFRHVMKYVKLAQSNSKLNPIISKLVV